MLRVAITTFLIVFNFVIQTTVFKYIEIIGVKPNSAVIIIVSLAILRGDVEGAIVGFFTGLLQDIFFGRGIGLNALLGMLVGFFSGKPFKNFYKEFFFLPLLLVVSGSLFLDIAFYVTNFLFRGRSDFLYSFQRIILPTTVYTAVLFIPIYKLLYYINTKVEASEASRRKMF